jgi:threonine dehydratase
MTQLPSLEEIRAAADLIHQIIPGTAQIRWRLLCKRAGVDVWVKQENHTPLGSDASGVIAATGGNHGQSIAVAASQVGLKAVIVVPWAALKRR